MASEPQPRPMLDHALDYVRRDLPVFPVCSPRMGKHTHREAGKDVDCKNPGKRPLVSWEPFQSRLPTESEVRSWWTRWPIANIGMATGVRSGVVVLDCDSGEARQEALAKGGLDKTPAVWTGKPGGVHFWLEHPVEAVRNFARRLPGLDFRGDGGYVLLPPSVHALGSAYRWNIHTAGMRPSPIPDWLWELLRGTREAADADGEDRAGLDVEEALRGFDEGQRDDGLFRFACRLRHDDTPQSFAEVLIAQAARACRPPFDVAEAVAKVRYVYKKYEPGGVGPTVIEDEYFSPGGAAASGPATGPDAECRYPIQTLADLLLLHDEEQAMIVDGLIWPRRVMWTFSDPSSGKTLFLLAALMHVAAGRPFCGKPVTQMPVLIFEEDSPLSVIGDYVQTLVDIYDFDLTTLPIWINKVQGLRITSDDGMAIVRETVESCPQQPGVVLFDACERMVPSDRFNTKELDPFTKTLQRLIGDKITPIVIDHTNRAKAEKGREQEFKANPMERLFGARTKSAISDVMLYFDGFLKNGPVSLIFAKFRGEMPQPMTLKFDGATGFEIIESPMVAQNENERVVIRFFNNAGAGAYSVSDVEAGVPLKRRTLERVLSILAKRRWLIASGSTTARRYHLNTAKDSF